MNLVFSDDFAASLKKHSSIKEAVRKKVNMICESPVTLSFFRFGPCSAL
jgi:hypothetical protein